MAGTPIKYHESSPLVGQSQVFRGIRFVLLGFDPLKKSQVSRKLVNGGGVDAGQYCPDCTHVIVDKIVYDDPLCVAARQDAKILVSSLWVDHSFDVGAPVDTTSVMYVPVRDLNGIPGAKSLVICLTGYQREDREDIMTMVELMGAQFSKPLIATKVTHLICYKFEGEKYLLAKRLKRIKLINHRWLEDCIKAWEIIPEAVYSKSGYELEMEAEARDSEDEPEGVTTRHNEGTTASPRHSLLSKQEIPKTMSNTSDSNLFCNAQETTSLTMKTTSDQSPNSHKNKIKHRDTENIASVTSESSNHYGKTVSSSPAQDNIFRSFISANRSPQNEAKTVISASYSMKDPIRTTTTKIDMKSNTSSSKRLNKLILNEALNMSSSPVQKVMPYSGSAYCPEDEQNDAFFNTGKTDTSCGSFKLLQMNQNDDMESVFQVSKKDPPIEMSSAQKPPSNISGRKSLSSKGKNINCEAPISITSNLDIENLDAVQRPQKEYNVMPSPSAVGSDLQKSGTLNSEINEQSAGSNSKPGRKKSISKKLSAPKLSKKITVNQKGSIFLKNTDPGIDDENLFKCQQSEKVSSAAKSGTKIEGIQIENMAKNKSLCMDDETEPPDDKDEANKEKREDVERENTVGNVDAVDSSTDKNNDENDLLPVKHKVLVLVSDGNTEDLVRETPRTKKGKKNTALSMKEISDKNELMIDNDFGEHEIREEATPNRANRAHRIGNDFEKSMGVKRVGVCNDPELINDEMDDDVDADMDIDNVVNKKETKRSKHSPSKTKKDVSKRNTTDLKKSVDVKRVEGACNDFSLKNDEKDDVRADKDADVDTENVLNKKETKRNKRPLSRSKKDDTKTVNKKGKPTLNKTFKMSDYEEAQKENEEKDNDRADMDTEIVMNKKETNRNKRPLSETKKDDANTVNKKGKSTSNKAVKTHDFVEAQKENVQIHVDDQSVCNDPEHKNEEKDNNRADMDLNKKETNSNKLLLSGTKKDDAKTVNKKGKATSNKAVKPCHLEEAQKENVQIHVNGQSTGKKQVFKPANKVNTGVLKDEPMWFILTGHNLQRKEFQLIIRRLKGRFCRVKHNWSYQATHFIVPDPIKRNEKFFAAAASGRWILKTDYLTASNQAGKFLPEETYEWHKKGLSEDGQVNLEAPRKWRLLKQKTGLGAFYGMKIVVYGECISPPLDTLKRAVKAGDGTILATSPPYTRFLTTGIDFAVVSPGMPHVDVWVQEFIKNEIPCISADYLVEYVCKPGYPLEKHVQYGTNVWAERSYNSLKKRLEEEISEPRTLGSDDVACEVCGARDRGEEMLICGDESGLIGCGVGTHIGCCDPPLEGVPEVDWFCCKCIKKPNNNTKPNNSKNKDGSKKKGSASRSK